MLFLDHLDPMGYTIVTIVPAMLGWEHFVLMRWPCFPWATDKEPLCSFREVAAV